MATKLIPIGAKIVVLPFPSVEKTPGGLVIPDSSKEKPNRGTVISIGDGTSDDQMIIKENDVVLYGNYAGSNITHEGKDYLILKQSEVLAVLREENN